MSTSNKFVLSHTLVNTFISIFVHPTLLVSTAFNEWPLSNLFCKLVGCLFCSLVASSTLSLLLITIDRWLAITKALRYPSIMTRVKSNTLVALSWIISLLIGFVAPLVEYEPSLSICWPSWKKGDWFGTTYFSLIFAAPLLSMIWIYGSLLRQVNRSCREARRNSQLSSNFDDRRPSRSSFTARMLEIFHKDNMMAAKTCLIMTATYAFCWAPFFSVLLLASLQHNPPTVACLIALDFALLSCIVNPVIYVFRNKQVRTEMNSMADNKGRCLKRIFVAVRCSKNDKQSIPVTCV